MEVVLDQIRPSPYQPRLVFQIDDLKAEIERDGLLSELIVRERDGFYELVDGERRWRALKELGWETVPVRVTSIDDRTARRAVFKLNRIRANYTVEEEARYFKKLANEGMAAYQIGKELNIDDNWVMAHLNVFKLPQDIQEGVWAGKLRISHVQTLEPLIGANIEEAAQVAREIILRKLSDKETRDILKPRTEAIDKARIEAAQAAIGVATPIGLKLETPEDMERAAEALRREAKRQREQAMTPEQIAALEAEKRQKAQERERKKQEERIRLQEAERRRIEEEAREKAKEELMTDPQFIRELQSKQAVLEPAEPEVSEQSVRMQPKFAKLRELEERDVITYTIWDFQYRDDYAGDKDFHGNCSPQIVEQCIWRLTNEGDLVVDPMAGSGTSLDTCQRYARQCIGYDIAPAANRPDIIQNDSRHIPLEGGSVDMVFIHPPYWNLVPFTRAEEGLPDLSRVKTLDEFLQMLKQVFGECYRILRDGKYMCVLLGDMVRDGKFIPLCRKTANLAEELGFTDCGYAVKLAHGEVSRKKSGVIFAELAYTNNLKISHDLVMFFRK